VTERGDSPWAVPDRPGAPPSYASDWPQAPAGRPPLPPPPARTPSPPPLRITLPPTIAPPARPASALRAPGGLIPVGPPRPIYREPLPVRLGPVAAGTGIAGLWLLLFGLLASNARGYAWLTFGAGTVAWGAALVLARFGDRGVAVGVAVSTAIGVAIAGIVVTVAWSAGHWLLW
jgi:hypothetical protein